MHGIGSATLPAHIVPKQNHASDVQYECISAYLFLPKKGSPPYLSHIYIDRGMGS